MSSRRQFLLKKPSPHHLSFPGACRDHRIDIRRVEAKFKPYTRQTIALARQWQWMSPDLQEAVQVVSHVLPFRVNEYVLDQLIDWDRIPGRPDLPPDLPAPRHAAGARIRAAARTGAAQEGRRRHRQNWCTRSACA
jgi:hypothetical protein